MPSAAPCGACPWSRCARWALFRWVARLPLCRWLGHIGAGWQTSLVRALGRCPVQPMAHPRDRHRCKTAARPEAVFTPTGMT